MWPCIFILFIPTDFSYCFYAVLAESQMITDNVYTIAMLFIVRDIVSQVVLLFNCRVCFCRPFTVTVAVQCFGEQKIFCS